MNKSIPNSNPSSNLFRHGGDHVASVLQNQGVKQVFTLIGGHVSPILVGCKSLGIHVADVRHEASAVFAADATARLTGTPGVAIVTAGPGVTNTVTAVKNAQLAQSPVVVLGGSTATLLKGRGALQDIDQSSALKPHVKNLWQIKQVKEIRPMLHKAFADALHGVKGPVFVEFPLDLLYPESIVRDLFAQQAGKSIKEKVLNAYINWHLNRLYSKGRNSSLYPKVDRHAKPANIQPILKALKQAKHPVLVAGSPVVSNPEQVKEITVAVEKLGIPVYLSGMARGLLGSTSKIQFRQHRKVALREADCVILAGVPCDFRLNYGRGINSSAFIASMHHDPKLLKQNRRPDVGVLGDPGRAIIDLSNAFESNQNQWTDWLSTLKERELARENEILKQATEPAEGINPLALFKSLESLLPEEAVLVADGGDFVGTASYTLRPRSPLSWLDPGAFGTLGVGGGFAMGAALTRPESEVWLIWGDGACGFSLAEFEAFSRQRFGIIAIVGNDGGWSQIERDQVDLLGDNVGCPLSKTDYHIAAEGLGGRGIKVTDLENFPEAVAQARAWAKEGIPVLLNVILGKSDFRKGSISV